MSELENRLKRRKELNGEQHDAREDVKKKVDITPSVDLKQIRKNL